ncbi:MAG: DUF4145 domain-containing protein [Pseudohongiella sp.]|nr:DUF4145 domain-containing protein [Pseudohongiella sp.]
MNDTTAQFESEVFECPHCGTIAQQSWFSAMDASYKIYSAMEHLYFNYRSSIDEHSQSHVLKFLKYMESEFGSSFQKLVPKELSISSCASCPDLTVWIDRKIVYPKHIDVTEPNSDLSEDIQNDYREAALIIAGSPRGSTALLRLALQKLLVQIGKEGKDISNDIAILVEEGLSPKIQQTLDLLRVTGDDAVHPGQIDINDSREMATKLFQLLNLIAEELITIPKELNELYSELLAENTLDDVDAEIEIEIDSTVDVEGTQMDETN